MRLLTVLSFKCNMSISDESSVQAMAQETGQSNVMPQYKVPALPKSCIFACLTHERNVAAILSSQGIWQTW